MNIYTPVGTLFHASPSAGAEKTKEGLAAAGAILQA